MMVGHALLAAYRFESPGYLVLLAIIPLLIALSFRSLSGLGPIRRGIAVTCRCLVVALMVLALAGMQTTRDNDDLSVIYLVDRSNSVPRGIQQKTFDFIKDSLKGRRPDDRVGVIAFDGVAAVEQTPMRTLAIDRLTAAQQADQTDIAEAVRLAMAMMPSDTRRRIVLMSDGNENVGNVLEEAQRVGAAGIPIDVVPLEYEHSDEVVFEQLAAPPTANLEETVNLRMVLRSQKTTKGQIRLEHNGEIVDLDPKSSSVGYPVTLNAGPNALTIPIPLRAVGAHRFEAKFIPDGESEDSIADNNEGKAFTVVAGQGKVLILCTPEADNQQSAQLLAAALRGERIESEVQVAGEKPLDHVRLLEYSLVIISNVSAGDFREEEKQTLSTYVRELGGGLVMVGGDDGFGAGGWAGSPIEDVMPVSFDVKNTKQIPKGALVLVMHACEIPQGNYWGEQVAIAAVKTLSSRDLVGILAWQFFGPERGFWVSPLNEVGNKTNVVQNIMKMSMGDLPDLDEVMRPGVDALAINTSAAAKHMIVISDFDPAPPRDDLLKKMKDKGITCSTVAIGYGGHYIDETKANMIATTTGGKFYKCDQFDKLPQIFVKEAKIVRRSLINEQPFTPRVRDVISPLIAGFGTSGFPQLGGMVLTTAKPTANVALFRKSEEGDDPVLAHWQVGLGKTVAFTSGMWNRWGENWVSWVQFSKLWAQVVRWASRQSDSDKFDVTTTISGGRAKVQVDAVDKNSSSINFMDLQGAVITPGQDSKALRLVQTGPGRYEAEFDARDRGNFIVNLNYRMGNGPNAETGAIRTGLSVAYSPEYARLQPNQPLLNDIEARTGGRALSGAAPAAAFDRASLPKAESRRPIWEDLIRLMLALFLIDVAVRRIAINPLEVARRVRRFIAEMGRGREPAAESEALLTTLKGTRDRVREERIESKADETGTPPSAAARYEAPSPEKATEDLSKALGGATTQDVPVVARPTGKKPPVSEGEYTSRLLKAKKRAQDDMRGDEEKKE